MAQPPTAALCPADKFTQWIGVRENLQETTVLPQKYGNVLKFPFQPNLGINRCWLIQVPLFFFGSVYALLNNVSLYN